MNSPMLYFLILVAPVLAIILACLGLETINSNWFGWVLLLFGIGYVIGGLVYYWRSKGSMKKILGEEKDDRSFWLILPGFLAVFFCSPLEYLFLPGLLPRPVWMQIIGLAFFLSSLALRYWARRVIREMYTGHVQIQAGHRLVQEGPYRYIRHPGYSGFLLMSLGIAIGYSSLIGLASIFILLLPGLAYRMKVEEKLLEQHFGDAYRHYARKTKRLVPLIW
jgi:protein-S-isoprenylcysteine O-methyltransferase Ste14